MHATHAPLHRRLRGGLKLEASFPPDSESRRYRKQILLFPLWNPSFGWIPAFFYTCLSWTTLWTAGVLDDPWTHAAVLGWDVLTQVPTVMLLLIYAGISFYALRERGFLSFSLRVTHFALQLAGVVFISWGAVQLAAGWFEPDSWPFGWTSLGLVLVGSWGVGSALFGAFLWVSAVGGSNLSYAYAALRIQDWKSFLRLRVQDDGTLTIYPIGFERVARRWSRRSDGADAPLEPEDPRATPPELIEVPIVVRPL